MAGNGEPPPRKEDFSSLSSGHVGSSGGISFRRASLILVFHFLLNVLVVGLVMAMFDGQMDEDPLSVFPIGAKSCATGVAAAVVIHRQDDGDPSDLGLRWGSMQGTQPLAAVLVRQGFFSLGLETFSREAPSCGGWGGGSVYLGKADVWSAIGQRRSFIALQTVGLLTACAHLSGHRYFGLARVCILGLVHILVGSASLCGPSWIGSLWPGVRSRLGSRADLYHLVGNFIIASK